MSLSPALSYLGGTFVQTAYVVKDLDATLSWLNEHLGIPRFFVFRDAGNAAKDKFFRGQPMDANFHLAISYSGECQIEVIQPVSGLSAYTEFIARTGGGMHHLGFAMEEREQYLAAIKESDAAGIKILMSGRFGDTPFVYLDTEPVIGSAIELIGLGPRTKELYAKIKRGDF